MGRVLYCWAWAARRAFFSAKLLDAMAEETGRREVGLGGGREEGSTEEVEGGRAGEGEWVGREVGDVWVGEGMEERSVAFCAFKLRRRSR